MSKIIKESAIVPSAHSAAFVAFIVDIAARTQDVSLTYTKTALAQGKTKISYVFTCETRELAETMLNKTRDAENIYNGIPPVDAFGCDSAKWY